MEKHGTTEHKDAFDDGFIEWDDEFIKWKKLLNHYKDIYIDS